MSAPQLRVALWCAVSSQAQATPDKTSLEDQESAGTAFAQAIGGQVVRVYRVPGHSRDYVLWSEAEEAMEAYRQLRQDLAAGVFDVLHATDPDRLGRDPALSTQVVSLVERAGAEVYLASAPHSIGHPSVGNRYLYAIQSVRAGEDQAMRVQRSRAGMRSRIHRGLVGTSWPVGYRPLRDPVSGALVGAEPDERAPAVVLAARLFVAGEPYGRIRIELDASPYPAPSSGHWAFSTVVRCVHNDVYAGRPFWGPFRAETPSTIYPSLWDEDLWQAVVRERAARAKKWGRRSQGSPLSGVAWCGRCGGRMNRTRPTRQPCYWLRCATHSRRSTEGTSCHANYLREPDVMRELRAYLVAVTPMDALDAALSARRPSIDFSAQQADVDRRARQAEAKRQRLALALAAGEMDAAMYRQTDNVILAEVEELERERAELAQMVRREADIAAQRQSLLDIGAVLDELEALPAVRLNAMLTNARVRIECEAGRVTYIGI